jgi:hypothetical protein
MVPAWIVVLAELPLTPNGKVDRKSLPPPDRRNTNEAGDQSDSPRTATEVQLGKIWSELLPCELVGRGDSFFELGGHSLLVTRLVQRIRHEFGVNISLAAAFEMSRLAEQAAYVDALQLASAELLATPGDSNREVIEL